jgi:rod shape-determining protein MreC
LQKKLSIVLLVIVFAALLVFLNTKGALTPAFDSMKGFSAPASIFFSNLSERTSGTFSSIFSLGRLQKENAQLKDNVNRLQAEVAQLSEAKKENEQLKKDLGFVTSNNFRYEAAEVLAFDPSNLRGVLTIDKGSKDGLKTGMAVISNGFLAGRISEVSEKTARVQLVTDPTSAIPVTLQSANTNGIARGGIGYGLTMEKIPQGEKITEGDTVITSGLGGEVPKGLVLGTVEKITRQENSLFIDTNVRPLANMGTLSRLIVILGQ